jgi:stage II sporulation protein D
VEVLSPNPAADARLAALGDALVREIEARVGQPLGVRPQVRVYPSTAAFRDETGEPGWVAASTRGRVIRMQPARLIEPRLRPTLKHELLHVWVDRKARPGTPVWFREGVALFLAQPGKALAAGRIDDAAFARARDRATLDRAYEEARSRVRRMVDRHGEATVLGWLATGLPAGE